jgi:hypothetical protein
MLTRMLVKATNVLKKIRNIKIYTGLQTKLFTSLWFFRTSPWIGVKSPVSNFRKVDFPTPFGPTMATREAMSIPKSHFSKMFFWPG